MTFKEGLPGNCSCDCPEDSALLYADLFRVSEQQTMISMHTEVVTTVETWLVKYDASYVETSRSKTDTDVDTVETDTLTFDEELVAGEFTYLEEQDFEHYGSYVASSGGFQRQLIKTHIETTRNVRRRTAVRFDVSGFYKFGELDRDSNYIIKSAHLYVKIANASLNFGVLQDPINRKLKVRGILYDAPFSETVEQWDELVTPYEEDITATKYLDVKDYLPDAHVDSLVLLFDWESAGGAEIQDLVLGIADKTTTNSGIPSYVSGSKSSWLDLFEVADEGKSIISKFSTVENTKHTFGLPQRSSYFFTKDDQELRFSLVDEDDNEVYYRRFYVEHDPVSDPYPDPFNVGQFLDRWYSYLVSESSDGRKIRHGTFTSYTEPEPAALFLSMTSLEFVLRDECIDWKVGAQMLDFSQGTEDAYTYHPDWFEVPLGSRIKLSSPVELWYYAGDYSTTGVQQTIDGSNPLCPEHGCKYVAPNTVTQWRLKSVTTDTGAAILPTHYSYSGCSVIATNQDELDPVITQAWQVGVEVNWQLEYSTEVETIYSHFPGAAYVIGTPYAGSMPIGISCASRTWIGHSGFVQWDGITAMTQALDYAGGIDGVPCTLEQIILTTYGREPVAEEPSRLTFYDIFIHNETFVKDVSVPEEYIIDQAVITTYEAWRAQMCPDIYSRASYSPTAESYYLHILDFDLMCSHEYGPQTLVPNDFGAEIYYFPSVWTALHQVSEPEERLAKLTNQEIAELQTFLGAASYWYGFLNEEGEEPVLEWWKVTADGQEGPFEEHAWEPQTDALTLNVELVIGFRSYYAIIGFPTDEDTDTMKVMENAGIGGEITDNWTYDYSVDEWPADLIGPEPTDKSPATKIDAASAEQEAVGFDLSKYSFLGSPWSDQCGPYAWYGPDSGHQFVHKYRAFLDYSIVGVHVKFPQTDGYAFNPACGKTGYLAHSAVVGGEVYDGVLTKEIVTKFNSGIRQEGDVKFPWTENVTITWRKHIPVVASPELTSVTMTGNDIVPEIIAGWYGPDEFEPRDETMLVLKDINHRLANELIEDGPGYSGIQYQVGDPPEYEWNRRTWVTSSESQLLFDHKKVLWSDLVVELEGQVP